MDIMSMYRAMTGGQPQRPDASLLELRFFNTVGSKNVTSNYATYGVNGNVLFVVADQPIDIRIDDTFEILNVKRQIITYPTKTLQIRRSPILIGATGNTNATADGSIGGRVRIFGADSPSVIEQLAAKIMPVSEGSVFSGTFTALATQMDASYGFTDSTLSQIQISVLSFTRTLSNITKIQILDTDFIGWVYASFSVVPALAGTYTFGTPIVVPNTFTIRTFGDSNASGTTYTIDFTFNCI